MEEAQAGGRGRGRDGRRRRRKTIEAILIPEQRIEAMKVARSCR